jgi:hypothetical protein
MGFSALYLGKVWHLCPAFPEGRTPLSSTDSSYRALLGS